MKRAYKLDDWRNARRKKLRSESDRHFPPGTGIDHGSQRPAIWARGCPKKNAARPPRRKFARPWQEPLSSILESVRITLERCPPRIVGGPRGSGHCHGRRAGALLCAASTGLVAERNRICRCISPTIRSPPWSPGPGRVLQELQFLKRVTSSTK